MIRISFLAVPLLAAVTVSAPASVQAQDVPLSTSRSFNAGKEARLQRQRAEGQHPA